MVTLKCNGCGYVQTLSEERFLAIQDDFVHCPHCKEKIPKVWAPTDPDSIPEDAKHKLMAFSRRILNGAEISRDIVVALESQARLYGVNPETAKALGIGYFILGEPKKAEEFLIGLKESEPRDPEVLHALLAVWLELDKNAQAAEVGEELALHLGIRVNAEDTARLAEAYLRTGETEKAHQLILTYPGLDMKHPMVRSVRRKIAKARGDGIRSLLRENPLTKFFHSEKAADREQKPAEPPSGETGPIPARSWSPPPGALEFWIYSCDTSIPSWERIREVMASRMDRAGSEELIATATAAMSAGEIKTEYVVRSESPQLFEYPHELIPSLGRGLSEDDRTILREARMIVRVVYRFAAEFNATPFFAVMEFVEALRSVKTGLVQDAVSHVLWGNEAWALHLAQPERDFMEHNILCEAVEESGRVWVHTHGMGKFGLPDLEMDGVPEKEAAVVSKWLLKAAELLVDARTAGGFSPETLLSVPGSQVRFRLEWRPGDPEQHFPFGSIRLHPYLSSDTHERAPKAAEQSFSAAPSSAVRGRKTPSPPLDPIRAGKLRQAMIDAHQCAQFELPAFKKSFLQRKAGAVYAVKVGFKAKGGLLEWMWVALDSWRGKALTGFVENTPVLRKDLRRGSRVQFSETEIFDWVIAKGGSVVKGGFTESVTMTA